MSHKSKVRSASRRMRSLYGAIDRHMAEAAEKYDPPCKAGCSDCCYQMVTASIAEMVQVVDYMERVCKNKARDIERTSKACADMMKVILDPNTTVRSWFRAKIPCVFLGDNGLCQVYDARPIACRGQMVTKDSDCSLDNPGAGVWQVNNREANNKGIKESKLFSSRFSIPLGYSPLQSSYLWALTFYYKGEDALRKQMRGSVFYDDKEALNYWFRLEAVDPEEKGVRNLDKIGMVDSGAVPGDSR